MNCIYLISQKRDFILNEASKYFPTKNEKIEKNEKNGNGIYSLEVAKEAQSVFKRHQKEHKYDLNEVKEIIRLIREGIPEYCFNAHGYYAEDGASPRGNYTAAGIY